MRTAVAPTSIGAYDAIKASGASGHQRARILDHIKSHGGDWTIGELAHALKIDKSTISARVNELLYDTGDLEAKTNRKDRRSNIMARPVGFQVAGQQELFQ